MRYLILFTLAVTIHAYATGTTTDSEEPAATLVKPKSIEEQPVETLVEPKSIEEQPAATLVDPIPIEEQPVEALEEPKSIEEQPVETLVEPKPIEEQPVVALEKPNPIEEQPVEKLMEPAANNVAYSLLDVADVGGEQAEEGDRTARSLKNAGFRRCCGNGRRWGGYGPGFNGPGRFYDYDYRPYWGHRRNFYWG